MPDADTRLLRSRLTQALVPLAATPERQMAYFGRGDDGPRDVALAFDATRGWTPQARAAGLIDAVAATALDQIAEVFVTMAGAEHAHLWSHDALASAPEWDRIRSLARVALVSLHSDGTPIPSIGRDEA